MYYILKLLLSAFLIATISEIAKRSTFFGAVLASIPLVSLLAILWLYFDTHNVKEVADLSTSIFWLVLPSLSFFLLFPYLLNHKVNFYLSLLSALCVMIGGYFIMIAILKQVGVKL
jgi:hypothetical protein